MDSPTISNHGIFIISLSANNDARRKHIQRQSQIFSLQPTIIDAVDSIAAEMNKSKVHEVASWLRIGQIGCALSHIECYQLAENQNLDFVVILEDDFQLKTDIKNLLPGIFKHLSGKSICLLHTSHYKDRPLTLDKSSQSKITSKWNTYRLKAGRPLCTTAYICTREAYQSLARNLLPIRTVADDWSSFLKQGFIDDIFIVTPLPVGTAFFPSQIGYGNQGGRMLQLFRWFVNKKIPVFKQLATYYLNRSEQKSLSFILE